MARAGTVSSPNEKEHSSADPEEEMKGGARETGDRKRDEWSMLPLLTVLGIVLASGLLLKLSPRPGTGLKVLLGLGMGAAFFAARWIHRTLLD